MKACKFHWESQAPSSNFSTNLIHSCLWWRKYSALNSLCKSNSILFGSCSKHKLLLMCLSVPGFVVICVPALHVLTLIPYLVTIQRNSSQLSWQTTALVSCDLSLTAAMIPIRVQGLISQRVCLCCFARYIVWYRWLIRNMSQILIQLCLKASHRLTSTKRSPKPEAPQCKIELNR